MIIAVYHKTITKHESKLKSYAVLVSTSTKAAHTFRHGIEHIDHSTINAMRKTIDKTRHYNSLLCVKWN